jgi:hypothetical protein
MFRSVPGHYQPMAFCYNCHCHAVYGLHPPSPFHPPPPPPSHLPPTPPPPTPAARRGPVCLAFLSGTCIFDKQCHYRHNASAREVQNLKAMFANTPCRYDPECRSEHCLFKHNIVDDVPDDDDEEQGEDSAAVTHRPYGN